MRTTILATTVALLALGVTSLKAQTIAYQVPTGTVGNQFLPGSEPQSLGMDFNVNSDIYIVSLGVFDSGSDGLRSELTAHIYDRDTRVSIAEIKFTPSNSGTLVGGSRFLELETALLLPAGFHGTIAVDYITANNELNGHRRVSAGNWTTDDGSGLISFVGSGRHSLMGEGAIFPWYVDVLSQYPDVFAAGTFSFAAVPEPSTIAFLSLALGGLGVQCWRRRSATR